MASASAPTTISTTTHRHDRYSHYRTPEEEDLARELERTTVNHADVRLVSAEDAELLVPLAAEDLTPDPPPAVGAGPPTRPRPFLALEATHSKHGDAERQQQPSLVQGRSIPAPAPVASPLRDIMNAQEVEEKSEDASRTDVYDERVMRGTLQFVGWRGRHALIHRACPLAVLKATFVAHFAPEQQPLAAAGVPSLSPPTHGRQQLPTVNLHGDEGLYAALQNSAFEITLDDLRIGSDSIEVGLDHGVVFQIVYQRGLGRVSQNQRQKQEFKNKVDELWAAAQTSLFEERRRQAAHRAPSTATAVAPPSSSTAAPSGRMRFTVETAPVCHQLRLAGWWGKDSCLVARDSALSELKHELTEALVPPPLDRRNQTPHINLKGSREAYAKLHNTWLTTRLQDIIIRRNSLELDVGDGRHYTLAFDRGVGQRAMEQQELVAAIWQRVMTMSANDANGAAGASPSLPVLPLAYAAMPSVAVPSPSPEFTSLQIDATPMRVRLVLDGWWGKDSCLVAAASLLGQLKHALVEALVPPPHDRRNRTPHINLGGSRVLYERFHQSALEVALDDVRVYRDWLEIDLGEGRHFTLAYDRGIGARAHQQKALVRDIWQRVLTGGDMTGATSSSAPASASAAVPTNASQAGALRRRVNWADANSASPGARLQLAGWWFGDACLVSSECVLAKLKHAMVDAFVTPPHDRRNQTAYIQLGGDRRLYAQLDDTLLDLVPSRMRIRADLIEYQLEHNLTFILAYERGLGARAHQQSALIQRIWHEVVGPVVNPSVASVAPESAAAAAADGSSASSAAPSPTASPPATPTITATQQHTITKWTPGAVKRMEVASRRVTLTPSGTGVISLLPLPSELPECTICMMNPRNCIIDCAHYSMCTQCAAKVDNCPVCRQKIYLRMEKLLIMS